ncbi:MAG: protein translocase subunit SecDF [Bacteroidota bacterium]
MQGKGLVKFFLGLLVLVTLYQFLLLLPTRKVEKSARDYATSQTGENNPDNQAWKDYEVKYLDSMSNEIVMNLGVVKMTYQDLKSKQLNLGLDLKGGMSVIMQVDLHELIIALSGESQDQKFLDAIQRARDREANAQSDFVTLFYNAWKEVAPDQKLASIFSVNPSLRDRITFESTDNEVLTIIREEADAKVGQTFNLIQKRIDKYGVTQPNVTLDKATNRIFVELPGVSNPKRAEKYLKQTAKLEFWETYTTPEITPFLNQLDSRLKALDGPDTIADIDSTEMVFDSLGNRIDSHYLENKLALENPSSTISQGPLARVMSIGLAQSSAAACGVVSVNDTSKVNDILETRAAKEILPKDALFLWGAKPLEDATTGKITNDFELFAMKVDKSNKAPLEGDVVTQAKGDIDPTRGIYTVSLRMNDQGAKVWRRLTKENINKPIAIALDSEVVSAPNVNSEIPNGSSEITGNFSAAEATDLANVLEVGKLPAKAEVISQDIVGPTLGAKNIRSGLTSLVIGICLVLAFMILYYGSGGIVSIVALFANLFFIIGALASYGTVLTLPGIAGIVLTIGMAVDANVIIYERIREELRAGKTTLTAIRDGFQHSYSAIVDANVTTILTALVLAYFGTGPIKGFAVVLIIGVICSLFTAVLFARLMIDWWTDKGRDVKFFTPVFKDSFANLNIDFVSKGKISGIVSSLIILVGIGSFFVNKFELGVDFQGGRTYTMAFDQANVDVDQVRTLLTTEFEDNQPIVKTFGSSNQIQVTTSYKIDDRSEDADSIVRAALYSGIQNFVGAELTEEQFEGLIQSEVKVGPTIADDIKNSAYKATIVALAFIFLYILLRFRKWQYGMGAVAALFHDVLIVLTLFSLFWKILPFSLEINQAFIAAILTVVGYSINDTVVVFDRIREFFNLYPNQSKKDNVNGAVNSTVSRTIITSLTTTFVILMLFIFGGEVIRGFAFALLIGVLVGTYSSVFIATPIVVALTKEKDLQVTTSSDKKKGYKRKVQTENS